MARIQRELGELRREREELEREKAEFLKGESDNNTDNSNNNNNNNNNNKSNKDNINNICDRLRLQKEDGELEALRRRHRSEMDDARRKLAEVEEERDDYFKTVKELMEKRAEDR